MSVRTASLVSIFALAALVSAHGASGQVRVEPRSLVTAPRQVDADTACKRTEAFDPVLKPVISVDPVAVLNRYFHEGDWDRIQTTARYLLDRASCAATASSASNDELAAYNYAPAYVWLTWIGRDTFETFGLHSVLVHAPAIAPYTMRLPGVTRIYEVFVSSSPSGEIKTAVTSTEQANPLLAQIPSVAEKVAPVLFGLLASLKGTPLFAAGPPPPPKPFWVHPFVIDLPFKRASIAVHAVAAEAVDDESLKDSLDMFALEKRLKLTTCARELLDDDVTRLLKAKASASCAAGQPARTCLDEFDRTLDQALSAKRASPACSNEASKLTEVDSDVRGFVLEHLRREVTSDVTFTNTPLQRVSFGLVEGVALGLKLYDPRVKLADDGTIKADPMSRLFTMVTVNASSHPYDSSALSPTRAEKCRWFIGAAIAPDFGLGAGFSFLPVRGFSLNVGVVAFAVKSAAEESVGKTPAVATDPFRLGKAGAWFFGFGYAFK